MTKTKTTLITLFLIVSTAIALVALPTANAASVKTYPVIGVTPNPVGKGQETLILLGITQATASALYGWKGLTITLTDPDGDVSTLGPFTTDSTGLTGYAIKPTKAGNYTLQLHFPEQLNPATIGGGFTNPLPVNTTMLASDSKVITLVVQEDPITYFPGYPLPTEYWTRPIDDQLREWSPIAGNWLTTPRNFLAVGNEGAPDTAHILWTTPLTSGGLVGGAFNGYDDPESAVSNVGYETGDAYEGKWSGSIVMGGKLYYQKYAAADAYKEVVAVDIHTGKQLWSRVLLNNLTLARGQQHYWKTYDNQGVYDYLWATANSATLAMLGLPSNAGTTWSAFDPFTGDYVYTLYGIPTSGATFAYGPKGELLYYGISLNNGYMTLWNSTNIPSLYASSQSGVYPYNYTVPYLSMAWGQWRPMGKAVNATGLARVTKEGAAYNATYQGLNGYQWNVTIPTGLEGSVRAVFPEDKIFGAFVNQSRVVAWALNLNPSKGPIGSLLYNEVWAPPSDWVNGNHVVTIGAISNIDKVFTINTRDNGVRYGFDLTTGKYKWVISEPLAMLAHLIGGPSGEQGYIAYGMLYSGTMSGVIQAFNLTNGELAWKYEVKDPYMQVYWSNNWPVGHLIAADGKIYIANLEHSVNQPLPRGGPFIALNATTGEEIFRANGLFRQTVWGGRAVIGDSIIATMDTYDQRIYGIGKGPSALTVSAGPKSSVLGSSVVIEGKVTDVSPGTSDTVLAARFPNGVPAVSDASMSDWMLYVYKQFARPTNATGVEVTLSVLDSNGNTREIGTTTSDSTGFFSFQWTPDITGKYTVYATFAGSKSYWPSNDETAFAVDEAPPAPAGPEPIPPSNTDTYVTYSAVAIIIAVALVGAVLALILRKRP